MAPLYIPPIIESYGSYPQIKDLKEEAAYWRRASLKELPIAKRCEMDISFPSICTPLAVRYHLASILEIRKVCNMAAKKAPPAKQWNGFVSCELTAEDKATFKVWDVDFGDAFDLLVGRVTEGYRFSLSHNKKNDSFIASLTGSEDNGDNAGYTLSAFGKDVATAMRVLAYKDGFILEGVWENAKVQAKDDIG